MSAVSQKIPLVRECCCGCSLKTGTLTITIIELVLAIIQFLTACMAASAVQAVEELANDNDPPLTADVKSTLDALYSLFTFLAIYFLAVLIMSSLAIHGARTENRSLLLPWLFGTIVLLLMKLVYSIVMMANADEYAKAMSSTLQVDNDTTIVISVSSSSIISQGVFNLIGVALGLYFFIVVHSYYVDLGNRGIHCPPAAAFVIHPPTGFVGPAPGGSVAIGFSSSSIPGQVQPGYYQQPQAGAFGLNIQEEKPPSYDKAVAEGSVY